MTHMALTVGQQNTRPFNTILLTHTTKPDILETISKLDQRIISLLFRFARRKSYKIVGGVSFDLSGIPQPTQGSHSVQDEEAASMRVLSRCLSLHLIYS